MDQLIRWGREEARVKASARPTATEEQVCRARVGSSSCSDRSVSPQIIGSRDALQLSAAGDLFDAYDGDRSGALSLSEVRAATTT
jgi:hypothetical protein